MSGQRTKIMIVDDDYGMARVIADLFVGEDYTTIHVDNGTMAIEVARRARPALVLLDVEMPGADGYQVCRFLKTDPDLEQIPVIFISAYGEIEDRLQGYQAGGDDYLIKPLDGDELFSKVNLLLRASERIVELRSAADFASKTAFTAMTSMGEMGVVLQALQRYNACLTHEELAAAITDAIVQYDLKGACQIRGPNFALARSTEGDVSPLEVSVFQHFNNMERSFQFKSRIAVTFDHISLLIRNLPVEDHEREGRLRDYLAVLAEAAEVRCKALMSEERFSIHQESLSTLVEPMARELSVIEKALREQRAELEHTVRGLLVQQIEISRFLGLGQFQESTLVAGINRGIQNVLHVHAASEPFIKRLCATIGQVRDIAQPVSAQESAASRVDV